MGYFDEAIMKKAQALLQEWEVHVNPPPEAVPMESLEVEDVNRTEVNIDVELEAVKKKSYMDLLRAERQQCYEEGTVLARDEEGIPTRPTTTLHCGTWQAWFQDVIAGVLHTQLQFLSESI